MLRGSKFSMPGDLVWQQDGEQAKLVCGPWQASLDALRPAAGLSNVSYQAVPLAESSFLGVDLDVSDRAVLGDCYVRGGDLIARYLQTAARPFAVLVYWRAGWFAHDGQSYPRIDLVVSVETSLLDSRPRLSAISNLNIGPGTLVYSGEGYWLADFGGSTRVQGSGFGGQGSGFGVQGSGFGVQGSGFRVQGSGFGVQDAICYAEMCHPDDSISTVIGPPDCDMGTLPAAASTQHVRCLTRLFGGPLEKGVILRSRMRGLFVPHERIDEVARAALAELVNSSPPLTT